MKFTKVDAEAKLNEAKAEAQKLGDKFDAWCAEHPRTVFAAECAADCAVVAVGGALAAKAATAAAGAAATTALVVGTVLYVAGGVSLFSRVASKLVDLRPGERVIVVHPSAPGKDITGEASRVA